MKKNLAVALLLLFQSIQSPLFSEKGSPPLRTWKYPIHETEVNKIRQWQNDLRIHLTTILSLPKDADYPKDFQPKLLNSIVSERYTLEEIEIQSTHSKRIKIWFGKPITSKTEKSFPAVVCIHGHGGNRWTPYQTEPNPYHQFGIKLLLQEFIVISTDIGQHEVREPGRTLIGERLWDLIRCVDYLTQLPFVDKYNIGCAGLSLGGEMAMWLSAIDTRIKATVVAGFLTVMDQLEQNHCMCWKFPGLREAVDFPDLYALIAPRALQCQNGEQEPPDQFPPTIAKKAWDEILPAYKVFHATDNLELIIHPGGHEIVVEPLIQFLKKHLQPNPKQQP